MEEEKKEGLRDRVGEILEELAKKGNVKIITEEEMAKISKRFHEASKEIEYEVRKRDARKAKDDTIYRPLTAQAAYR